MTDPLTLHPLLGWISGMCTDERPHHEIDDKVQDAKGLAHELEAERDRLVAENERFHDALETISHLFAPSQVVSDARRIATSALTSDDIRPAAETTQDLRTHVGGGLYVKPLGHIAPDERSGAPPRLDQTGETDGR